jgi:hypothetical protein
MTAKKDFSEEEWIQLLKAPTAAGLYIMMADPNFVIGTMKEALTVSSEIVKREKAQNSELLAALLADFSDKDMARQARIDFDKKNLDSMREAAWNALRKAVWILDQKATPDESSEIRQWLFELARKTAEAATEGGFLGFGGTRVSEKEEQALGELKNLLRLSAPPA